MGTVTKSGHLSTLLLKQHTWSDATLSREPSVRYWPPTVGFLYSGGRAGGGLSLDRTAADQLVSPAADPLTHLASIFRYLFRMTRSPLRSAGSTFIFEQTHAPRYSRAKCSLDPLITLSGSSSSYVTNCAIYSLVRGASSRSRN